MPTAKAQSNQETVETFKTAEEQHKALEVQLNDKSSFPGQYGGVFGPVAIAVFNLMLTWTSYHRAQADLVAQSLMADLTGIFGDEMRAEGITFGSMSSDAILSSIGLKIEKKKRVHTTNAVTIACALQKVDRLSKNLNVSHSSDIHFSGFVGEFLARPVKRWIELHPVKE